MKDFYGLAGGVSVVLSAEETSADTYISTRARVAAYDGPASAPYIEEVGPARVRDYIEALSARVYALARDRGGEIPYTVIRELAENYIHAGFAEPVISILDEGSTIRFSDQGPGIPDKDLALCPGYTTATSTMKGVIRGVGSGLPIVNEFLAVTGGSLEIDDNLRCGSVITISSRADRKAASTHTPVTTASSTPAPVVDISDAHEQPAQRLDFQFAAPSAPAEGHLRITTRQKQVLALVLESGSAGPSLVSQELRVGLSTAYRDLASLEALGLIAAEGGKRALTPLGLSYLGGMASPE